MPAAPVLGEGLVARKLVIRARDVGFLKGIVEAHDGLAVIFAESGGDLILAAAKDREAELDALVQDLARELDGVVAEGPAPTEGGS